MRKESFNIDKFQTGDIISQVARAPFTQPFYNENLGIEVEVVKHTDGSFLGIPMKYLGVANNHIILEVMQDDFPFKKGGIRQLHLDQWNGIWAKWVDPESLRIKS